MGSKALDPSTFMILIHLTAVLPTEGRALEMAVRGRSWRLGEDSKEESRMRQS